MELLHVLLCMENTGSQLEKSISVSPFLVTEICFLSPVLLTVTFNEKRLGVSSEGQPPVTTSYYQCSHGIAGHALFLCRHICQLNVDKLLPVNKAAKCTWAENGHHAGGKLGGTHVPPHCAASLQQDKASRHPRAFVQWCKLDVLYIQTERTCWLNHHFKLGGSQPSVNSLSHSSSPHCNTNLL